MLQQGCPTWLPRDISKFLQKSNPYQDLIESELFGDLIMRKYRGRQTGQSVLRKLNQLLSKIQNQYL